jgi:hypothetical protein
MQYFWEWAVKPMLRHINATQVLEIGASLGHNTEKLMRSFPSAKITVIDPCLDTDLVSAFAAESNVHIRKGKSLDVLPSVSATYDTILIDGDHNFHTVYNELKLIAERNLLAPHGVIFLHDIGEPYGAKDLFYNPADIPDSAKAPGAPQGVRTAIDAFMAESPEPYTLLTWDSEHGLGCLMRSAAYQPSLRAYILFWHLIRWKNRLFRKLGLMPPDHGRWGDAKPTV